MADLELTTQGVRGGADISECGRYRYTLWRRWGDGPVACFVMLNPSTADATEDDPTIRKCMGFARRWGLDGIRVSNLFAYRTAYPRELTRAQRDGIDIVGPGNMEVLGSHMVTSERMVVAWGSGGGKAVRDLVGLHRSAFLARAHYDTTVRLQCLGASKDGSPRHPLMLAYDTPLEPWPKESGTP
ncbi:MAG: DUF1643 domain-containing protein [Candidatus Deferrimicrobiaceae bacterium]